MILPPYVFLRKAKPSASAGVGKGRLLIASGEQPSGQNPAAFAFANQASKALFHLAGRRNAPLA
jgi:hypothetical protein